MAQVYVTLLAPRTSLYDTGRIIAWRSLTLVGHTSCARDQSYTRDKRRRRKRGATLLRREGIATCEGKGARRELTSSYTPIDVIGRANFCAHDRRNELSAPWICETERIPWIRKDPDLVSRKRENREGERERLRQNERGSEKE